MSVVEKFGSNRVIVECRYNPVAKRYRCNIAIERKRHGPFLIRKPDAEAAAIKALAVAVEHGMIDADDIEAEDGAPVVCALPVSQRERRAPTKADAGDDPAGNPGPASKNPGNGKAPQRDNPGNKSKNLGKAPPREATADKKKAKGNSGKPPRNGAGRKKAKAAQLDGADQQHIKVIMPDGRVVPIVTPSQSTRDRVAPTAPTRRSSRERLTSQVLSLIQEQYNTVGKPPTPAEVRLAEIRVTRELGPRPNPRRPEVPLTEEQQKQKAFAEQMDKAKREEAARRVAVQEKERKRQEAEARQKEQLARIERETKALG